MAGTDRRFDATKFRSAIKFAMEMGFPDEVSKQITWHWNPVRQYNKKLDASGMPFDLSQGNVNSEADITPMIVDCAVKFQPTGTTTRVGGTALGIMDVANATATLLDVDYNALRQHGEGKFPDKAVMDTDVYLVQLIGPPYGLFEVTIYDVYLQAIDET